MNNKNISWVMFLCCIAMILIAFFVLSGGGTSQFIWVVVGICVVGHIAMMFLGYGYGKECDEKIEKEAEKNNEQVNKNVETKKGDDHRGGCCH